MLLGHFQGYEGVGQAIVVLGRSHFPPVATQFHQSAALQFTVANNIYGQYVASLSPEYNSVKCDIIFPCTETHIRKHLVQAQHIVRETPDLYLKVHLPYIKSIPPSTLQWVRNVVDKTAERERLLCEDEDPERGFVFHPGIVDCNCNNKPFHAN